MEYLIDFFTKNIILKVLAIILAFIFWFIVQAEQITQVESKVNVHLETPDDVIIEGGNNRNIEARLQGPKAIIAAFYMDEDPLQASITIPHKQTAKIIKIRMHKRYISNLHERINIEFDEPYLEVLLHQKIKRLLPVRPVLVGKPKVGHTVEKIVMDPSEIEVVGGANELASLTHINNVPLNITDLSQSTLFEDVMLDLSTLKTASLKNTVITIKLLLGEEKQNKKFTNIPVKLINASYHSYFSPKVVTIEVQGTRGIINFIKPNYFHAVIYIKDERPGKKINKKVQVKIPPNTTLIETTPEWITVKVSTRRIY